MSCGGCKITMTQFIGIVMDKERFMEWLRDHGVIARRKLCPHCRVPCTLKYDFRFVCGKTIKETVGRRSKKRRCNFSLSARKNTFFEQAHISLQQICRFVMFWAVLSSPHLRVIKSEVGITAKTLADWSAFCRDICIAWRRKNKRKIGGHGKTVEIEEAKFRKRKISGKVVDGKFAFGGFERESKSIFLRSVNERNSGALLSVIKNNILPGTTVISGCFEAYDCSKNDGFKDLFPKYGITLVNPSTAGGESQNIERIWREVRAISPKYGRSDRYFKGCLSEYLWKKSQPDLKDRIHCFFQMISDTFNPNLDEVTKDAASIDPLS